MYLSKRSPLMIFLSLVLVILTACAPTAPTSAPEGPAATEPPSEIPETGATEAPAATDAPISVENTLVIDSNIDDLITLDPAVVYEYSGILITHNVYQTLVTFEGSDLQTIKPGLADSWETNDAGDHWELTFKLQPGNTFASGNPITADDVVYSFNRVIAINGSPAFLFSGVGGLTAESVTAVDPETVQINLPKTASPGAFLAVLTNTVASVVDSKVVQENEGDDHGSSWLLDHSAGSGAYVIDHWTPSAEVLLTANPSFSGDKPALTSVLIRHVPESANQLTELQNGDADLALNLTAEQLATLGGDAVSVKGQDLRLFYVGMNVAVEPLDKVEVREALRMAIDYDGIVNDLLSGNAQKVQTIIPSPMFGYNSDTPFQQDVEGAKALLEQAGVSDVSLELMIPDGAAPGGVQWSDLAAKLQSDWAQIGVTVEIRQVTFAELLDAYRAQGAQLALLYWGPDFADPDTNVTPFTDYEQKAIAWRNSWNDPDIAAQAKEAALMTDAAEREAAYKEITDYVLHNGPYAILYQPAALFGVHNTVSGFEWNPMGFTDFWKIVKIA
ncbi:MAG TPA: ABC transporter substrate-binding protein [Anaerolineales bacterium]|nr:ABC transporter substrate-binding protein [Anaerolineales bacterium]